MTGITLFNVVAQKPKGVMEKNGGGVKNVVFFFGLIGDATHAQK